MINKRLPTARTIRSALKGNGPIGTSVKVIEKPGPSIVTGLIRNNPFPRTHCGRELCPLENCQDKCAVENVTYRADCMLCSTEQSDMGILHPPVPVYVGETSRTLYIRANQHYKDCTRISNYTPEQIHKIQLLESQDSSTVYRGKHSSFMMDHYKECHGNVSNINPRNDFKFSIIKRHNDPFTRQTEEAVRINQAIDSRTFTNKNNNLIPIVPLNRRGEIFAARSRNF